MPADIGRWLNSNLEALARQGKGGLPPVVDWSNPPRYAIPLWIEGEKFFFWALVYASALLYPFLRRTGLGFPGRPLRFSQPLPVGRLPLRQALHRAPRRNSRRRDRALVRRQRLPQGPTLLPALPQDALLLQLHLHVDPPSPHVRRLRPALRHFHRPASSCSSRRGANTNGRPTPSPRSGTSFLTFGMLIGYPWALQAWGPNWWWDPKIASSIMMWLLYSAYLHTQALHPPAASCGSSPPASASSATSALVFTYFMAWFFPGEHTF